MERIVAARGSAEGGGANGGPILGRILLVEHEPVITVSQRASAAGNVVATAEQLAAAGVAVEATDRGGDVTYHGPGQLVAYPILDLNAFGLRLHDYMRLLEESVIEACGALGVAAERDPLPERATGVWVRRGAGAPAKLCAMGVRVRRWVSMHGLALNVTTNLEHFGLIVPCGLAGRPVTSLAEVLAAEGREAPAMGLVKAAVVGALRARLAAQLRACRARRERAARVGDGAGE